MRLVLVCLCLVTALLARPSAALAADDAPMRVVLVDPEVPALAHRLREEIESLGIEVVVVPKGESDEPLEARARAAGAVGAIRVTSSGTGAVEMTIVDRATGKTVSRRLAIATPSDPASAELVATRTVELLRASLMELEAPHPPRGDVPVTTNIQALAEEERDRERLSIAVGPTLVHSADLGAALGVWGSFAWMASEPFGATAELAVPVTSSELVRPEGTLDASIAQYRLGAVFEGPLLGSVFAPFLEAGATLAELTVEGSAESPYVGSREHSFTGGPWVSVGFRLELTRALAVRAAGDAAFLFPETVVRSAGDEVLSFGRPLLTARAGMELSWH